MEGGKQPPLQTQSTTQSEMLQHTGDKGYEYTTNELDPDYLMRQGTKSPYFELTEQDIAELIGEAKKYKIEISERDLRSCGKRATQLFKQKSITSDIIQNMVDEDDDFKMDDDMMHYDMQLPE